MDAARFDAVARVLATGSRRGVLGVLLALPWLSGPLALLLPAEDTDAKKRRKRRTKRHKHGKGNGRHRKGKRKQKKCKAKSRARICAGKCGSVKNKQTCKKKVDCGACACDPACDVCFTCEDGPTTPGVCVPDPAQQGEACGEPGQVCRDDGTCACDASSCAAGQHCQGEVCVCDDSSCSGCCAGEACQPGTAIDACGTGGGACQTCGSGQLCQADGSCACDAASCSGTTPICVGGACMACSAEQPCASGCCAGDGSCQPGTTNEICGTDGETCHPCGSGQLCVEGECKVCLAGLCEPGSTSDCQYATLQEAIDDAGGPATLNLCAETYPGPITIDRDLTMSGAGSKHTILDGPATDRVLTIAEGHEVTVLNLKVTGGAGGISSAGALTLSGVAVTGNTATDEGGGIYNDGDTLTLDGSRVTGNTASAGGGIFNDFGGEVILETGSRVSGNTAEDGGGIYNDSGGEVTLQNGSLVTRNTATDDAGGIYNSGGTVTLENGSRVSRNTATDDGGGIFSSGEVILENGSLVTGNTAKEGGGIFTAGGDVTLQNGSRVSGNTATENGGGIANLASTVEVEAGAFVCNNTPASGQCFKAEPPQFAVYIGDCPSPGASCSA